MQLQPIKPNEQSVHVAALHAVMMALGWPVDRAEVERWAKELGYLEIWQQIVAKVDAPDSRPGPGAP